MEKDSVSKAFECVRETGQGVIFPHNDQWYIIMSMDAYKEALNLRSSTENHQSHTAVEKINEEIAHIASSRMGDNPSIDTVFSYGTLEDTISASKEEVA